MLWASRMLPSAARATENSAPSSTLIDSASTIVLSLPAICLEVRRRKSNRWHLESTVAGIFCASVVAMMNLTCSGGSSSVLRNALNAAVESMWTSSMM